MLSGPRASWSCSVSSAAAAAEDEEEEEEDDDDEAAADEDEEDEEALREGDEAWRTGQKRGVRRSRASLSSAPPTSRVAYAPHLARRRVGTDHGSQYRSRPSARPLSIQPYPDTAEARDL